MNNRLKDLQEIHTSSELPPRVVAVMPPREAHLDVELTPWPLKNMWRELVGRHVHCRPTIKKEPITGDHI